MSRRLLFVALFFGLSMVLAGLNSAEVSHASTPLSLTYQADYFDNQWLSGDPMVQRKEAAINFNWSEGSPGNGIPNDFFSARWTSNFTLAEATTMQFFTEADDGIRILVNGQVVLNAYGGQAKPGYTTERQIPAGPQEIVIEYFEHSGQARAHVTVVALDGTAVAEQPQISDGDCVIPATGPWPPCASGGGTTPPPASGPSGDCVIPASGPWPPCATAGDSPPPASKPSDCVIPATGPWPPCAR